MRRWRAAAAGIVLGALAIGGAGCVGPFASPSGEDRARSAVQATAKGIATAIDEERPRTVLASDFAFRYSDSAGDAVAAEAERDVVGGAGAGNLGESATAIEALAWNGMTRDEGGAQFVLRISVHVAAHSANSFGDSNYGAGESSACYAFRVHAFFAGTPTTADSVDCPPAPSAPPPSPAPVPALPADAHPRLEAVLVSATAASLSADLLAAFPDDAAAADPVTGARLIRDSGAEDGVLAAAVGIARTTDCAVGIRELDGTVRTWHPQDITLSAGEAGCAIGNALHPVTTH